MGEGRNVGGGHDVLGESIPEVNTPISKNVSLKISMPFIKSRGEIVTTSLISVRPKLSLSRQQIVQDFVIQTYTVDHLRFCIFLEYLCSALLISQSSLETSYPSGLS